MNTQATKDCEMERIVPIAPMEHSSLSPPPSRLPARKASPQAPEDRAIEVEANAEEVSIAAAERSSPTPPSIKLANTIIKRPSTPYQPVMPKPHEPGMEEQEAKPLPEYTLATVSDSDHYGALSPDSPGSDEDISIGVPEYHTEIVESILSREFLKMPEDGLGLGKDWSKINHEERVKLVMRLLPIQKIMHRYKRMLRRAARREAEVAQRAADNAAFYHSLLEREEILEEREQHELKEREGNVEARELMEWQHELWEREKNVSEREKSLLPIMRRLDKLEFMNLLREGNEAEQSLWMFGDRDGEMDSEEVEDKTAAVRRSTRQKKSTKEKTAEAAEVVAASATDKPSRANKKRKAADAGAASAPATKKAARGNRSTKKAQEIAEVEAAEEADDEKGFTPVTRPRRARAAKKANDDN